MSSALGCPNDSTTPRRERSLFDRVVVLGILASLAIVGTGFSVGVAGARVYHWSQPLYRDGPPDHVQKDQYIRDSVALLGWCSAGMLLIAFPLFLVALGKRLDPIGYKALGVAYVLVVFVGSTTFLMAVQLGESLVDALSMSRDLHFRCD